MEDTTRQNGLNRSEIISLAGLMSAIVISAAAGFINWGAQSARVELLQSTVINLNSTVTVLNSSLQDVRIELTQVKTQREGTEQALKDLKSSFDNYARDNKR